MGLFDSLRRMLDGSAPTASTRAPLDARTAVDSEAIRLIDEGNALEEAGQPEAAVQRYEAALDLAPTLPRAHLNVGNIRLAQGDVVAAIASYETALRRDPRYAGAHFNLGNAWLRAGRFEDALASYQRAIGLDAGFVDAHVAAGAVLEDLGRAAEAITHYQAALTLSPGHAPVHSNLGNALKTTGRFTEAIAAHRRALALDPTLVQALNNLGSTLKDIGALDEAEAAYRDALALRPDNLDARSNLLFLHNYRAKYPAAELRSEAEAFGRAAAARALRFTHWSGSLDPNRPLRIGLVSGDLRQHPVGFFLQSVIESLTDVGDGRLQLTAFVTARCDDALAARIRARCHGWHEVQALPDAELAALIHREAIDVLIDLSGHTAHHRLPVFAWKPSPVQVSWLGYFATTGVAEMDHLIADAVTLPARIESHFTEHIWRLPETRFCFTAPEPSPPVEALPALTRSGVTFGCFNQLAKITDDVVELWSRVLTALPTSRLLLKSPPLQEPALSTAMIERFVAHGIDAERLSLEGLSTRGDYLAAHARVDIALDPFPFPGGTTTAEALWMGVPVLTMTGESLLARQGVGLLTNAGLPDWIAADADEYLRIATERAADLPALAALRARLRPQLQASPVMDAPRFAHHLDAALHGMWRQRCATAQVSAST